MVASLKMLGIQRSVLILALWLQHLVAASDESKVKLSLLSNVYLPSGDQMGLAYGEVPVKKVAYSSTSKQVYAAGKSMLHVIDFTEPSAPTVALSRFEADVDFAAIAVCKDKIFVSARNTVDPSKGQFRVYSSFSEGFNILAKIEVGVNPGGIAVRPSCKTAVIALEGNPYVDATGNSVDPEGEIIIADVPETVVDSDSVKITRLGFQAFNKEYEDRVASGVRFPAKNHDGNKNGVTFSQDLEPKDVVIDAVDFEETAYVTLQENNAFAKVDLSDLGREVVDILGLGSREEGSLDASDVNAGPDISPWPIKSWYQPSGIKMYNLGFFFKLLIVANEGSARDYEKTSDITQAELSDSVPAKVKEAIEDDSKLGRLQMSVAEGKNSETGKYDQLYTFGGRGFSIWQVFGPHSRLFDSADQIEKLTAEHCPHLFNRNVTVDDCSDDMGPQPNTIAVGEMLNDVYIFVGVKNPGTIFVYKLGDNPRFPEFQSVFCDGIPNDNRDYQQMYQDQELYAAAPMDIKFLNKNESPSGKPVLMVTGARSGTVTFLDINLETTKAA